MRLLAVVLTIVCTGSAQKLMQFRTKMLLPDCDAIVVGDLLGGKASDSGRQITVNAMLRVQRALKGSIEPGSIVRVAWSYLPNSVEGPRAMATVPAIHALWLLNAADKPGEFRAAQLSLSNARFYYLLFPPGDLSPEFLYSADESTESKLARELGFALESHARQDGSRLNVMRMHSSNGTPVVQGNIEQLQFSRTAGLFRRLPPEATVAVLRRFASSSLPNLRIIGLLGLIRLGDVAALSALERDFDGLAQTSEASWAASALAEMPADLTSTTVQTLGRLALSETELLDMELLVAGRLGASRLAEALPYLAAMLESPSEDIRLAAARGFCAALRPIGSLRGPLDNFWTTQEADQCPSDLAQVQGVAPVRFWREWWKLRRMGSAVLSKLPQVKPPARYRN